MTNVFTYIGLIIDETRQMVRFTYQLEQGDNTWKFTETLHFPVALADTPCQRASLRALHLALGISYYKIFVSDEIVQPYAMDQSEVAFWNTVWREGLGEFLYVNKLDPAQLAQFKPQAGIAEARGDEPILAEQALLGIGGGKDSIVAGEALKATNVQVEGFVMATGEQRGQAQAVADVMQVSLHGVERTLDPELLRVQQLPGAYQGHVPVSLVFALVGTALALALGKKYVVVANEASASIPRQTSEYGEVNHQWSKSFLAEQLIQNHIRTQIGPVDFCSVIRPLTSLAVAKLFAQYPPYFDVFTSDNSIFRIDPAKRPNGRWSLESPKSLSSFILLAPWITEADLVQAFGRDFLNESSLEPLFLSLIGYKGEPPLDCVGTTEELMVSLNLAAAQGKFGTSFLIERAKKLAIIRAGDWQAAAAKLLQLAPETAIPAAFADQLMHYYADGLA